VTSYVINGAKRWIGNGSMADCGGVVGPLTPRICRSRVSSSRKGTPGYDGRPIAGKGVRCAPCGRPTSTWTDVRIPVENRPARGEQLRGHRQGAQGDPSLLRGGRRWGHAVAGYDAALNYAAQRTQFGKPLARFQIVQGEGWCGCCARITAMQLYCQRIGALDTTDDMFGHHRRAGAS